MENRAILCVDDEPMVLESIVEQLKNHFKNRFIYETAQSGPEALEITEYLVDSGVKIVIIISDWLMPGMKGDDFLIEVHKRYPDVVTIMLTGQADENAVRRAEREAELFACIHKPWTQQNLIQTVEAGLNPT